MLMQKLPPAERPRERLSLLGSDALSNSELLAIVMGSGTSGKSVLEMAQELLAEFGDLKAIAGASTKELCQIKGLGIAKAMQLQAAFSLAKRLSLPLEKVRITGPYSAYQLVRPDLVDHKEERLLVVLQDAKGCVTHKEIISIGTLTEVLAHPRDVFYPAIRHKAAALLIAHNHPSGDPTPSRADLSLTRSLLQAARTLQIPLSDHLIIGDQSFTSLRETLGADWM